MVLAADQFTKHLALTHLDTGVAVPVAGDALQLLLVFNPGAAFSLGEDHTWIFTIAMALVAGVILFLAFTRVRSRLWVLVLGLLLGGVLGNLGDRLFRAPGFAQGHVVDFILTPWMWFWMPNSAIYNVADIFIVGGMAAVALLLVLGFELDGTRSSTQRKRVRSETSDVVSSEEEAGPPADEWSDVEASAAESVPEATDTTGLDEERA